MKIDEQQGGLRAARTLDVFSPLRRRRTRIWATVVLIIVATLALQEYWGVSFIGEGIRPFVALLIFLAAMICEYVDSSLGMGYGTTLTPLLLLAGFEPLAIVPCVLLSELVAGLLASLMHHRDGNVDFLRDRRARQTAVLLSMLSVVGVVAAVTLALNVPRVWLGSIIAAIILSAGVATLATIRRKISYSRRRIVALGIVAAFNKALSGGGYGPLVTSGQLVSGMPPKHAVAITSLAEAWTCVAGLTVYVFAGGPIDWALAVPLTLGAALSVPMATLTVRCLPEVAMRASVGGLTCVLGVMAMVKVFL